MKLNRKTTKITALVMCVAMLVPSLVGCGLFKEIDKEYKGPTFNTTITDAPTNFDPMYAYLDDSAAQLLSFIYEGLFKYDEKGKPVKALCDSYEWVENDAEKGKFIAEFKIKDSAWSDTVAVTANDFVFAWRRVLDPGNHSEAAALLYDVKNARKVKSGDAEIYDLGATASGTDIIRVEFEHEVNLDEFIANLASPCLVPLRTDVVDKIENWATIPGIVVANGPFYLKTFNIEDSITFERNRYYLRDVEEDEMYEYVSAYRVVVYIGRGYDKNDDGSIAYEEKFETPAALYNYLYTEGLLSYYSNIGVEYKDQYSDFDKVESKSTHTYMFNTNNKLFADARVRKALSMAIDREAMAKTATVAGSAAQGIVPQGIYETAYSKKASTFRDIGGNLIGAADVDGAKALLKEAGVTSGSFSITVRGWDNAAVTAANYAAEVWNSLGFNVTVKKASYGTYNDAVQGYENLVKDDFLNAYKSGDFDIIAIDLQQHTNTAFSALAPYATTFSGASIDLSVQQDEYKVSHKSGYSSAEYDALIESAFAEKDSAKKAEILHQAEKMLMEDRPVMPLFTFGNVYTTPSNVKNVDIDWFGSAIFTEADDKNYEYVPEE